MSRIGFIGMGNMGSAIMSGLLDTRKPEELVFSCKRAAHGEEVQKKTGVPYVSSNAAVAREADIILLAVKPIMYGGVIQEIAGEIGGNKIVISMAPGITAADLSEQLGGFRRIVRCMPNTPAMIKEGVTGVAYDETLYTPEEEEEIRGIFTSFGKMVKMEERLIDVVTVVSGSSPAVVYMLIDTLANAGVRYGFKKSDALQMAAQAVVGSAKMVLATGEHPAALSDKVCSPGGTTIAEVAALEEAGFRAAIYRGADACYRKCTGKN